jgi:hypothetical protein
VTRDWLIPLLVLGVVAAAAEVRAEDVASDPLVARRMSAFYEVYTGRKLTAAEVRQIAREFGTGHARDGKSRDQIRELAREFGFSMILLREDADHAAALTLRHQILERNYFRPSMQNTLELRLMTEPDPVRVVDTQSRRLMTERDVVALANLRHFAKSQGEPRHRELPRKRIDELVSLLKLRVARDNGTLPQFFGDAAAYWAGVRQQWPYFNAQQRSMARAYARNTWRVTMPVEMYACLWGLDRTGASNRWSNDVSARIRGRPDTLSGLADLQAALDSAFEP